ncbi:hypothetical protein ACFX1X_004269 [Malus domestica]
MPGLDPTLIEHRMPIKEGFKPVKQAPRRMSKEIEEKVKEEIERLVKVRFIRPAKYVEWLANIIPILKVVIKQLGVVLTIETLMEPCLKMNISCQ